MATIDFPDSNIVIPPASFDDRGIAVGGGEAPVSEPIIDGGDVGTPEDRFGTNLPEEPKPANPKLDEAIKNRDKLDKEYNNYLEKGNNTLNAKETAKAEMEAQRTIMEEAKKAHEEAKKLLKEAKAAVKSAGSTEEAAAILKTAQDNLDNANSRYQTAVKGYNTSVKKINKYLSLCLKRNAKLVKMQKGLIKANEKAMKLGSKTILPDDFGPGWYRKEQAALKSQKVLSKNGKVFKTLKTAGAAGGIVTALVGVSIVVVAVMDAIVNDKSLGDVFKEFASELGSASEPQAKPAKQPVQAEQVTAPQTNPEAEQPAEGTPPDAASEAQQPVVSEKQAADESPESPEAAPAGTETEEGAEVQEEPAQEVDETAVEEEIAAEQNEPMYVVQKGDNLWNICKKEITEKNGKEPTGAEIMTRIGEVMAKNGLDWEADHYHVKIYPKQKLKM